MVKKKKDITFYSFQNQYVELAKGNVVSSDVVVEFTGSVIMR